MQKPKIVYSNYNRKKREKPVNHWKIGKEEEGLLH